MRVIKFWISHSILKRRENGIIRKLRFCRRETKAQTRWSPLTPEENEETISWLHKTDDRRCHHTVSSVNSRLCVLAKNYISGG